MGWSKQLTDHETFRQVQAHPWPGELRSANDGRERYLAGRQLSSRGGLPLSAAQVPCLLWLLQQRAEPALGQGQHALLAVSACRVQRWSELASRYWPQPPAQSTRGLALRTQGRRSPSPSPHGHNSGLGRIHLSRHGAHSTDDRYQDLGADLMFLLQQTEQCCSTILYKRKITELI